MGNVEAPFPPIPNWRREKPQYNINEFLNAMALGRIFWIAKFATFIHTNPGIVFLVMFTLIKRVFFESIIPIILLVQGWPAAIPRVANLYVRLVHRKFQYLMMKIFLFFILPKPASDLLFFGQISEDFI